MNYKKLALIGVGVLTLFVSTLMPLFASSSVSADPTPGGYSAVYKWVDAQTIQDSNGITYIFNKVSKTGLGLFVATTRPGISCTLPSNSDHVEQIEMPTYTYNSQTKQRKQTGVTYISYDYDEFAIYNGANIVALNMGDVSDKWYPSGKINDFYLNQSNAPFGTVVTFSNPPAGDPSGLCGSNKPVPLQTQDLGNATILYDWFDSRTIVSLKAAGGKTYKNNDPTHPNRYTQTGGGCQDYIEVLSTGGLGGPREGQMYRAKASTVAGTACTYTKDSGKLQLGMPNNYVNIKGSENSGPVTDAAACVDSKADANNDCVGGSEDGPIDCELGALNWIVCPVILGLESMSKKVDGFIMDSLDVNVGDIFDNTKNADSPSNGYYRAWNAFRILAFALIIIAGLVMVVSQALGLEVLDAYTIRKTLPRLIIALIGIALSWQIMRFFVALSNTAGIDIRHIMTGPFDGISTKVNALSGIGSVGLVGLGLVVYGPAAITFFATAALALLVGFVIIVLREIALVTLVMVAPIAIACAILPNTQKIWKLFRENFSGLLLMFPIISAIIAAGHIFATVSLRNATGDAAHPPQGAELVRQAIGLLAYFLPYFALPLAARFATGVIGNLAGMVNDRSRGAFDRLKKYRGNKAAQNMQAMKAGNRFSDRNIATRGFNRATVSAGTGWKGRFGMGERGTAAVDQARRTAAAANIMKSPEWAAIQEDDDVLRAATYNSAAAARRGLLARGMSAQDVDRAISGAQTSIGFGRSQAIAAAQQLAATGTGYTDMTDQALTIARAAGGNKDTAASIAGFNNFINKQKGRHDLAPGAGNLIKMSQSAEAFSQDEAAVRASAQSSESMEAAWNSGSLYQHANGKPAAIKAFTKHWVDSYGKALAAGDTEGIRKARTAFYEMGQMLSNTSGDGQNTINQARAEFETITKEYLGQGGQNRTPVDFATIDKTAEAQARVFQRENFNQNVPGGNGQPNS